MKESRVIRLSEALRGWAQLALDDDDGLPLDLRSIWVKWDGNRTLWVRAKYYQPPSISKRFVCIRPPYFLIHYPEEGREESSLKCLLYLTPVGVMRLIRPYEAKVKARKVEIRDNELTFNLTLPRIPPLDAEIRISGSSILYTWDYIPSRGWWWP
mgnify:CR=1 FL=1